MKDNTSIKKQSPRPADPVLIDPAAKAPAAPTGEAAEETARLRLRAFPDGGIFKFTPHPTEAGRFVLYGSDNVPVAVVSNAAIADLLCNAVQMLFSAVAARQSLTDEELAANNAAHKERAKQASVETACDGESRATTCAEVEGQVVS